MSDKTASQVAYEKAIVAMAKERFWQNPETVPEAIAKHYCSLAMAALQLATLIKAQDHIGETVSTRYLIDNLTDTIKNAHRNDFGTEIIDTCYGRPLA